GQSHANVALGFLSSQEGLSVAVTKDYTDLLNRAPDQTGLNGWVALLQDNDPGDTDDFNDFNHSTANDSDSSQFASNFQPFFTNLGDNDASLEEVAVNFLTSPEFVANHPPV